VEELRAADAAVAPGAARRPVAGAVNRERWSLWGDADA
jgi:hypothetical protein